MVARALRLILSLLLVCAFSAAPSAAGAADGDARVWVKFKRGKKNALKRKLRRRGARLHHEFDRLERLVLTCPASEIPALAADPDVASVETDEKRWFTAQSVPYGVDQAQARDIWDADRDGAVDAGAPTGAGRTVCVIDSGLDAGHEDFAGVDVVGGYPAGWDTDGCAHGTHVAGTVAAANNDVGVVGVSPGGVSLYVVKVFGNNCDWVYSSSLVDAAERCAAAGATVISMSLGGPGASNSERAGFDALLANGVLSVAAAGNDGNAAYSYPASYDSVISVAAVDAGGNHASFSQRNDQVELAAAGVGVQSTVPGGYASFSGTSMATPHVSAAIALVWSGAPSATAAEVRAAMQATAADAGAPGRDDEFGHGIIQAKAALDALTGGGEEPPPEEPPGEEPPPEEPPGEEPPPEEPPGEEPPPEEPPGDVTPPTISKVRIKNQGPGKFVVSWRTDEKADTVVRFACCGDFIDPRLRKGHRMRFVGDPNTVYTITILSTDEAGNTAIAGPFEHKTKKKKKRKKRRRR